MNSDRILNALIVFAPLSVILRGLGASDSAVFASAALAIIPLAKLLGDATETLAAHYNPTAGAFLNATLGNAAELIIGAAAISSDQLDVVRASITGAILGNVLLILGISIVAGGLKNKELTFNVSGTGLQASMLFIALTGLAIPRAFFPGSQLTPSSMNRVEFLSDSLAVVLISVYILGLVFTFFTHKHLFEVISEENHLKSRNIKHAGLILLGSVGLISLMSELLVGSINGTVSSLGVNKIFVGVVVIGIVGNVAEHFSAVSMALKNKLDLSIGIAAGSGAQIAIFVTPLLVIISELQGHQLNLLFDVYELVAMFAGAVILIIVSYDGKSNWFEGVQLIAVYLVVAIGFYFLVP